MNNHSNYYKLMTDGYHSRREYKKLRRKGCTPEQSVLESLDAIASFEMVNDHTKRWVKREIDIIKLLLPISKF